MVNIDPQQWYSIKELREMGVILKLGENGIRDMITKGKDGVRLKARRIAPKGHWRVSGQNILDFLSQI